MNINNTLILIESIYYCRLEAGLRFVSDSIAEPLRAEAVDQAGI